MKKSILILVCFLYSSITAQDTLTANQYIIMVDSLEHINESLVIQVDSLNKEIEKLEIEIERSLWERIEEGLTMDEVIEILGDPDEYQEADFGYKKLIYGEGYSGYILVDKELTVVDSTPPLYLRMENDLITR